MKCCVLFFMALIFWTSCSTNNVPKDVIQQDAMVTLLVDIQLAEAYVFSFLQDSIKLSQRSENLKKQGERAVQGASNSKLQIDSVQKQIDHLRQQVDDFYAMVYKKHHTNKAQFDKSLKYYSKDPEVLDKMYAEVNVDLKQKMKDLKPKQ